MMLDLAWEASTTVPMSDRVLQVAAMFGLTLERQRPRVIVAPFRLRIAPGDLVFLTGPSGGGKSTLLRLMAQAIARRSDVQALCVDALEALADTALVDALAAVPRTDSSGASSGENFPFFAAAAPDPVAADGADDLAAVMADLARVGLGDALVMLRRPSELSEGQRTRLRLAQAMGRLRGLPPDKPVTLLIDEFAAPLDRVTAAVLARQMRRWVDQMHAQRPGGLSAVIATTHEDLVEALAPDVLVYKDLGPHVHVKRRERGSEVRP